MSTHHTHKRNRKGPTERQLGESRAIKTRFLVHDLTNPAQPTSPLPPVGSIIRSINSFLSSSTVRSLSWARGEKPRQRARPGTSSAAPPASGDRWQRSCGDGVQTTPVTFTLGTSCTRLQLHLCFVRLFPPPPQATRCTARSLHGEGGDFGGLGFLQRKRGTDF